MLTTFTTPIPLKNVKLFIDTGLDPTHTSYNYSYTGIFIQEKRHSERKGYMTVKAEPRYKRKHAARQTYLQNLNNIFSNTSTGPVLPSMVRGWPANREYAIPVMEAPNRDSIALWNKMAFTKCIESEKQEMHSVNNYIYEEPPIS